MDIKENVTYLLKAGRAYEKVVYTNDDGDEVNIHYVWDYSAFEVTPLNSEEAKCLKDSIEGSIEDKEFNLDLFNDAIYITAESLNTEDYNDVPEEIIETWDELDEDERDSLIDFLEDEYGYVEEDRYWALSYVTCEPKS